MKNRKLEQLSQAAWAAVTVFALMYLLMAFTPIASGQPISQDLRETCEEALNDSDRVVSEMVSFKEKVREFVQAIQDQDTEGVRSTFEELQNIDRRVGNYLRWYQRSTRRCSRALEIPGGDLGYR